VIATKVSNRYCFANLIKHISDPWQSQKQSLPGLQRYLYSRLNDQLTITSPQLATNVIPALSIQKPTALQQPAANTSPIKPTPLKLKTTEPQKQSAAIATRIWLRYETVSSMANTNDAWKSQTEICQEFSDIVFTITH